MVCDNQAKGASATRTLTVHATGTYSNDHWDSSDVALVELLTDEAAGLLGWRPDGGVLKRWRYSTPVVVHPEPTLSVAGGSVVLAGDAFGGPTMEGALRSGLAAAALLV